MATVEAIDRAIAVIEELSAQPSGAGLIQIAKASSIAPSTAHRYLQTLEGLGIVEQTADRRYLLTPRLFVLGLSASGVADLDRITRPALHRLTEATQETSCIMVRDGMHSVCIDRVESAFQLKIAAVIGRRQDLRAGATSRVLLAYAPVHVREEALRQPPLASLTPNTVTDGDSIRTILSKIHHDGYFVSRSEVDEGVIAVAAPIQDQRGEVIAAIAVAAPESRMKDATLRRTIADVVAEANSCSAQLGYKQVTTSASKERA